MAISIGGRSARMRRSGAVVAGALAVVLCGCSSEKAASFDAAVDLGVDAAIDSSNDLAPDTDATDATDGAAPVYPDSPLAAVDVFVGTGGVGYGVGSALPGATMPFSLVKLSPDTVAANGAAPFFSHCGGYAYDDPIILGFSHTHFHGVGMNGYGNVLMMPIKGQGATSFQPEDYRSPFSHDTEVGSPGYYAVTLDKPGIRVELSAGMRVGYHRWTWPADTQPGRAAVVVDLGQLISTGKALDGEIEVLADERRLRGWMRGDVPHGGVFEVYFDARFDRPFSSFGTWGDGVVEVDQSSATGTEVGAFIHFDLAEDRVVTAEVGISYVSLDGARENREAEKVPSFDAARQRAEQAWTAALGQVALTGGAADDQRIFYSALYHLMQHPTQFSDADGSYRGLDHEVHQSDRPYYTDFSLWDTYRTAHPLLILLQPQRSADMAQSLVLMSQQWGLPRWPAATNDTGSMIGTPADVVLSETWLKGITDFDIDAAWEAMLDHAQGPVANGGRRGIADYLKLGYVAADHQDASVAKTLEYGWNDFALANLAEALGKPQQAALWEQSRTAALKLWHQESGFFRGRNADGSWVEPFDPTVWEAPYAEGDAWQYLWLSPHVELLESLLGSSAALVSRLEQFFDSSKSYWDQNTVGFLVPLPYYWHGNEPDLHAAYLFVAAGKPSAAQRWIPWIIDTNYALGPEGLPGNDDAGTLSAWYVFSALGLYPWAGSTRYYLGTPRFDRAAVHLENGSTLEVVATDRDAGPYVQAVTLDGEPLDRPWLTHDEIKDGATLTFVLGSQPSTWGEQ